MDWSKSWKSSKNRRKQRKYLVKAPLHVQGNFVRSNLAKDLRKQLKKKSISLRKGDRVEILRGEFKGLSGEVESVNRKNRRIYVSGISRKKVDGSEAKVSLDASNLRIIRLNASDKKRFDVKLIQKEEKKEDVKSEGKVDEEMMEVKEEEKAKNERKREEKEVKKKTKKKVEKEEK